MIPEIENIGLAIVKGVCNPEAEDIAIDLAGLELDALFDEKIFEEIPIIKSVIACRKTWSAIQDRLFLQKVVSFFANSPKFTKEQQEKFIQNHLQDPKEAKRLSDAIVLILNRLDDLEKPEILAKVFAAFVKNKIQFDTFRRLATAIDAAQIEDLRRLLEPETPRDQYGKRDEKTLTLYANLFRTALVGIHRGTGTVPMTGVSLVVTDLGKTFIECINGFGDKTSIGK
jgi:hypothetical protein